MSEYLIQKETLDGIAVQSMNLAGKTEAVSPATVIEDLNAANEEVASQTDLLAQIQAALANKTTFAGVKADDLTIVMGTTQTAEDSTAATSSYTYNGTVYNKFYFEAEVTVSVTIPEGATLFGLYLIYESYGSRYSSLSEFGAPSFSRVTTATTDDGLTYTKTAAKTHTYSTTSSSYYYYVGVRARLVALYKAA